MDPSILAIESSCDETSAAVISNGKVLNNIVASQSVHLKYGGVVPELASRAHQQNIVSVVAAAMDEAAHQFDDLDAIAFTRGPGLMGSLLVGASYAKGLSIATGKPLIDVNHLHAHILSHFIDDPVPSFPFICLTVSGGHTELVLVRDYFDLEVLGRTQDDAAGEAFDKAAKMMGLEYPGGPLIDHYAKTGNPSAYVFPDTVMPNLDFSFSGLKTAFLYFLRDHKALDVDFVAKHLNDICASVQHRIVLMLINRLKKASEITGIKAIAISGGVSANTGLRNALQEVAHQYKWNIFIPQFQYCTDNAAMIAMTAHFKYQRQMFCSPAETPKARWEIEEIANIVQV